MRGAAIYRCKWTGDAILPYLNTATEGFQRFDGPLSMYAILDILASVNTENSDARLRRLCENGNYTQRFVGYAGLAFHRRSPESINADAFLVRVLLSDYDCPDIISSEEPELAARALGVLGDCDAVPFLVQALSIKNPGYWFKAEVCDALGRLGDKRAVDPLRTCLRNAAFFPGAHAFDALLALNDKDAIPLATARISSLGVMRDLDTRELTRSVVRETVRKFACGK